MLQNYDFATIPAINTLRLVCITNETQYKIFYEKYKSIFHKIYITQDSRNHENLSHLTYENILPFVTEEINIAGTTKNIRLFPFNEYNLYLCATLREKLNIPGPHMVDIYPFRNKMVMKDKLRNKMRIPQYASFNKEPYLSNKTTYFNNLKAQFSLPFIVKPVDAAGSLGVVKVNSLACFDKMIDEFSKYNGEYGIEEYIEGKLFHVDIILKQKKPVIAFCAEYNLPLINMLLGKTVGSIPLPSSHLLHDKIIDFSTTALHYLQAPDGISHTEVFVTANKEIVFLESACRAGGAGIIPMYNNTFGVNLANLDFQIQMDIAFDLPTPHEDTYHFWGMFPKPCGKVKKLVTPNLKSCYHIEWKVKPGDVIAESKSMRDKGGNITAYNKSYTDLYNDFMTIKDHPFIDVT